MDCVAVQPLLSPYLDGELDGADREAVLVHIDHCDDCRQKLNELRGLSEIWSSTEPREPSERDWQRISRSLNSLDDNGATRRFRRRTWFAAGLVIALCTTAGVAIAKWGGESVWNAFNRRDPVNLIDYLDGENGRQGKTVDPDHITDEVDLKTLHTNELPNGFKLKNCCVFCDGIVRYKFARNGSEAIVLLYPCGLNVVHGNKKTIALMIGDDEVLVAQCKVRASASWQVNNTAVSLICSRDLSELSDLVKYINNQLANAK